METLARLTSAMGQAPLATLAALCVFGMVKLYTDLRKARAEILRVALLNTPAAVKLAEGVTALERLVSRMRRDL